MNVWTDIAIGNLQRHRGPPMDMDIETGEIKPMEMFVCAKCGDEKPASDYYLKTDRKGRSYRQVICKQCVCARERKIRPKHPKPPRPYQQMIDYLTEPRTVRQIQGALGITRDSAMRTIDDLIAQGKVVPGGFSASKYHSRIQTYITTAALSARKEMATS